MSTLRIYDYATLKNEALVAKGIDAHEATATRERFTGHKVRIGPEWARSIGAWGGVFTLGDIAERVGKSKDAVKSYAAARGLTYRTKTRERTPAELAVLAFAALPEAAQETAKRLGILPVEVCLYREAMADLLRRKQTTFDAVLRSTTDALENAWQEQRLSIAAPMH